MSTCLPVTIAVPVRNEGTNLARCLERLDRFAEIVVIDSNSTDDTVAVAEQFGARVEQFSWDGRYPKKRNWFLLNAPPTQPWVLFLDADEFVDEAFCNALERILPNTQYDGFWLNYTNVFLGRVLRFGVAQRKLALFRVGQGIYERIEEDGWSSLDMEIHEHPIIKGAVGAIPAPIEHRDFRGLAHYINKHRDYAQWEARRSLTLQHTPEPWTYFTGRQRFKYRHISKWWYPAFYFLFAYAVKGGFRDGAAGFHLAFYKAWYFHTIRLLMREYAQTPMT